MSTLRYAKNFATLFIIITPCYFIACSTQPAKNSTPKTVAAEEKDHVNGEFGHLTEITQGKDVVTSINHRTIEEQQNSENQVSVWQSMHDDFRFPTIEHTQIDQELSILLSHPVVLRQNLKAALPLIEYVLTEIQRRNLPSELALIPFIESGYTLNARSSRRAKGLWQLMPATASSLGLQQTWWQDDSYNVVLATDAALNYLQSLHKRFDDWIYTLAAYNWGPARLSKGIGKTKASDEPHPFFSIRLPKETQRYIPKLLAYKKLISQRKQYAHLFEPAQMNSKLKKVYIEKQTSLAVIANIISLEAIQVRKFNPGYKRWATPPDQYAVLLLPQHAAELADRKLPMLSRKERLPWNLYRIKPGDTLSEIAHRNRISTSALKNLNTLQGDGIVAGKFLKIPTL